MQINPDNGSDKSEKTTHEKIDNQENTKRSDNLYAILPGIGLIIFATIVSQTIYFPKTHEKCDEHLNPDSEPTINPKITLNTSINSLNASIDDLSSRKLRHSNNYDIESIKLRFARRKKYFQQQCKVYLDAVHQGVTKDVIEDGVENHTSWMIYSRNNDFLLCAPPKTGTSNWQRSLVALEYNNYYTNTSFSDIPMTIEKIAKEVSPQTLFSLLTRLIDKDSLLKGNRKVLKASDDLNRILESEDITRIMHVRHPFLRLHSAWTDKFSKNFNLDHDIRITKMFRHYDYVIWLYEDNEKFPREENARVSFYAFLRFLAKGIGLRKNVRNGWNGHWAKYDEICFPCVVDYAYITRLETIDEDTRFLFDKAGFSEKIGYFPPAYNNSDSVEIVENMFKKFPEGLVDRLYDLYYWDFKLFGYDKDNFTKSYLDE